MQRPRWLICTCCGERAYGRQWWNQDTGYGLCKKCIPLNTPKDDDPEEQLERRFGPRGVYFDVPTPEDLLQQQPFIGVGI